MARDLSYQIRTSLRASGSIVAPGFSSFDDDMSFLNSFLPMSNQCFTLGDQKWVFPSIWRGKNLTITDEALTAKFEHSLNADNLIELSAFVISNEIFLRKSLYLLTHWSDPPLALNTAKGHLSVLRHIVAFASDRKLSVSELSSSQLLSAISSLPKYLKNHVGSVHALMRRWRRASGPKYSGYQPPIAERDFDPFEIENTEPEVEGKLNEGGSDPETRKTQPLPDTFLTEIMNFCFVVLEDLHPKVLQFLNSMREHPNFPRISREEMGRLAADIDWPSRFEYSSLNSILKFEAYCQTSVICIISLLTAPRWSEIGSSDKMSTSDIDGFINLITFKGSQSFGGIPRKIPVHPEIRFAIDKQTSYINAAEGNEFPYLWRQHRNFVNSGLPLRTIDTNLKRLANGAGAVLSDDSSFHHHRFRASLVRIIVLALHGGIVLLRRLLGHEHLGITLGYLSANTNLLAELEAAAQAENRKLARFIANRSPELTGGGADAVKRLFGGQDSGPEIFTATGYSAQKTTQVEDILDALDETSLDEFQLNTILPGLICCTRPLGRAGMCSSADEAQDVAKCDVNCAWHIQLPEFIENVENEARQLLKKLSHNTPSGLAKRYILSELARIFGRYPDLRKKLDGLEEFAVYLKILDGSEND